MSGAQLSRKFRDPNLARALSARARGGGGNSLVPGPAVSGDTDFFIGDPMSCSPAGGGTDGYSSECFSKNYKISRDPGSQPGGTAPAQEQ